MSSAKARSSGVLTRPGKGNKSLPAKAPESRTEEVRTFTGLRSLSFGAMLFFSGTAALVYQILWIRQLSLVVGVEVYSITIAVSAFFAGLVGGGALLGGLADRWKHPLRLYFLLEAGIALAGVAATFALAHAAGPFVAIQSRASIFAWALPLALVGAPAFLMGGTLPAAIRWQSQALVHVAKAGGWVYAANTAGGIAGALLSSFVLLPWLGVRDTSLAAALCNLAAAAIALSLNREAQSAREARLSIADPLNHIQSRAALALYAVAGGIALGYEVVWSQALAQFMSTRVFAFSVTLAVYLAGLALGSALFVRFAGRVRDTWGMFGVLISAAGFVALFEIAALGMGQLRIQMAAGNLALAATGSELFRMCTLFAVAAFGVVFVPTVLLGAAFPAVLRLTVGAERAGRDVGVVLALNTAGGIAGTLLTGFYLVPVLGLVRTLSLLAIAAALVGALAVLAGSSVSRMMQGAICILGLASIACGILTPSDRLSRLLVATRGGNLVFYEEGRGATVAVAEQQSSDHAFRRLYIQGVSNSGDAMPSLRYMRLQAMLPLLIHRGEARSALVIGFGTGITAGAALRYPQLERRVCVELLPAVVSAGKLFPENYNVNSDPKMQIRIGDGRQELLRSTDRYDLITLEPPPPSAEGVVNLYSTDFYRLAGKHLEPNGLFAQWLPIATQNREDTRSLIRSFLDAFPYATLWTTELHEMLLVGSSSPITLNADQIASRFAQSNVSTALQAVGIASPAALLATWVTGRDALERFAAGARPVTDDDPRIEYATWVRPREVVRTLPDLLALHTDPPVEGADDALHTEIERQRVGLWAFYSAGIAAYNGDREQWSRSMQAANDSGAENPYYAWIAGDGQ
jgi:spermidine synthase